MEKPRLESLKEIVWDLSNTDPIAASNDTIIITSIYKPFWGTQKFMKSCERLGYEVVNAFTGTRFTGNGDVIQMIYKTLLKLREEGKYKKAAYLDGADTILLKKLYLPDDKVVYSTEKAVWPPLKIMSDAWERYYADKEKPSEWLYLNGGGYGGPIDLLIEFFEKYGLTKLKGDINGQFEQAMAYINAHAQGFPIYLDNKCVEFQTIAHSAEGDFEIYSDYFRNLRTNTLPAAIHGNGRTGMEHLYRIYNL